MTDGPQRDLSSGFRATQAKAPRTFLALSTLTIIANGILAVRLVWEQTALTWRNGPQMVGFALVHGLWFPLVLSPLLMPVLGIWGIIELTRAVLGGLHPSHGVVSSLGAGVVIVVVILTPYGFWQRMFVGRLTEGPYVGEFVTEAAATGDLKTVAVFLNHGVPVDISGRNGTALHAAAVGNQPRVIEYLLAHGASVNAINPYGDSPLEDAMKSKSEEAARLLQSHGGQRVQGTKEHRDSVSAAQVDTDIARLEGRPPH